MPALAAWRAANPSPKGLSMIGLIIALVVVGVLVYVLNTVVEMDRKFRIVVNALIGLCLFFYVLQVFGVLPASFRLPK